MIEIVGWVIVLGLAVAIAGICMLSNQIEKHLRETTEMMIHSNDMIVSHLRRLANPAYAGPESIAGVILERRCAQRRNRPDSVATMPQAPERRIFPGRRLDDRLAVGQVGYLSD